MKEEQIDDMLNSLDGIQRAEPPADLFERSMARAKLTSGAKMSVARLRPAQTWAAAACLLVLLLANVFACLRFAQASGQPRPLAADAFAREFFSTGQAIEF